MIKKLYIGKDFNNYKITLDLEIKEENKEKETIDHKKIKKYKILTISGGAWNFHRKDFDYCGQIYDELTKENIKVLANSMTWDKLNRIVEIWKEWHLNDMQAKCIHQDQINLNIKNWQEEADKQTLKCPNNYRYGNAWLLKELPEKIEKEVIQLFN